MRNLNHFECYQVNGGDITHALLSAMSSTFGAIAGFYVGAHLFTPMLEITQLKEHNYTSHFKDFVISRQMGAIGLHSETDLYGAIGGSLIGCLIGSSAFSLIL